MRKKTLLHVAVITGLALARIAAGAAETNATQVPPPPAPDYPLIPGLNGTNAAAAREAWTPMRGSAPVESVDTGGGTVLRLPCKFAGAEAERASWDAAVQLDLTECDGIQFQFFCADATPVAHFNCYMKSGDGWYAATFDAPDRDGWGTVEIRKSETTVEGNPSGWGDIEKLRISAWRGGDVDSECLIAGFGRLGVDAPVVIIRADSAAREARDEMSSVQHATSTVAQHLRDAGIRHCILSDADVTPKRLEGRSLVILPHNPVMSKEVAFRLDAYLRAGGKMICFYRLPASLAAATGIKPGAHMPQAYPEQFSEIRSSEDALAGQPAVAGQHSWNIQHADAVAGRSRVAAWWFDGKGAKTAEPAIVVSSNTILMTHILTDDFPTQKQRLLLAMVGHFMPELWPRMARERIAQIGCFGPYTNAAQAEAEILRASKDAPRAAAALDEARDLRGKAEAHLAQGRFPEALEGAATARAAMLRAYCAEQTPAPGEHRAFWCHSAFGVNGMSWDAAAKLLADNGFTAVMPNMLWGGAAYYDSKVLPVVPEAAKRGDQIRACLAACRRYGLECHVWKVNWNMGWSAPAEFMQRMKLEGRTQESFDGRQEDRWLCPSHPTNQQLEIDAMLEVATNYDVDGIHFDYIRYPGNEYCFCAGCRARFEQAVGATVTNWPAGVRSDARLRAQWLDFRRAQITRVVEAVSTGARRARPGIRISAAVFSNWTSDRDAVGQDWKLWCEKGWLDFVCPMDYTPSTARFTRMVRQQREWAGKARCYPGIGLSTWTTPDGICTLLAQIKATRELHTGGFTVFNYGISEAQDEVPLCGLGITRPIAPAAR